MVMDVPWNTKGDEVFLSRLVLFTTISYEMFYWCFKLWVWILASTWGNRNEKLICPVVDTSVKSSGDFWFPVVELSFWRLLVYRRSVWTLPPNNNQTVKHFILKRSFPLKTWETPQTPSVSMNHSNIVACLTVFSLGTAQKFWNLPTRMKQLYVTWPPSPSPNT